MIVAALAKGQSSEEGLFAAIPPMEAPKAMSEAASEGKQEVFGFMVNDVVKSVVLRRSLRAHMRRTM